MKKKLLVFLLLFLFLFLLCACSTRVPEKTTFVVSFETMGGEKIKNKETKLLSEEPQAKKTGYVFEGWYTEKGYQERVFFPYQPVSDVTLYAKYIDLNEGNEENRYVSFGDGVLLSSYDGFSANLVLAKEYEGKEVLGIAAGAIRYPQYLTTLYFHKMDVVETGLYIFPYLTAFVKIGEGGSFTTKDGVLFTDENETLYAYPRGKQDAVYTLPDGTKKVGKNAFRNANYLQKLVVNGEMEEIDDKLDSMSALQLIEVKKGSRYSSEEGVLFCEKELIRFPAASTKTTYTLPDKTESIRDDAFSGIRVENLVLNAKLQNFGIHTAMDDLVSITVADGGIYQSKSGVLYKDDRLIRYPSARAGKSFSIPEGVTTIETNAFYQATYLREIVFPKTVVSVPAYAIISCEIEKIEFCEGSGLMSYSAGAMVANGCLCDLSIAVANPPRTVVEDMVGVYRSIYVPANVVSFYAVLWREVSDVLHPNDLKAEEYTASFIDGEEVTEYLCACIVEEPLPKKDGYSFQGWYLDESFLSEATFPVLLSKDTAFFAKWNALG